jgi:hypothetical protein
VSQVGEAVGQMDQVTQQNAALVEESAAAAESLKMQALQLVQAVAAFKLNEDERGGLVVVRPPAVAKGKERRSHDRAKNVARPAFGKAKSIVHRPATAVYAGAAAAPRTGSDNWEVF